MSSLLQINLIQQNVSATLSDENNQLIPVQPQPISVETVVGAMRAVRPGPKPTAVSVINAGVDFQQRVVTPHPDNTTDSTTQNVISAGVGTAANVGTKIILNAALVEAPVVLAIAQPIISNVSRNIGDLAQSRCHQIAEIGPSTLLYPAFVTRPISTAAALVASTRPTITAPAATYIPTAPVPAAIYPATPVPVSMYPATSIPVATFTPATPPAAAVVRAPAMPAYVTTPSLPMPPRLLPASATAVIQRVATSRPVISQTSPASILAFEEVAERMISIAGNMTGVLPALDQATQLKTVFTNIMASPHNAPQMLVNQFYKGNREIFQRMVSTPAETFNRSLADPSISSVAGIVTGAFSIISLTNEIFPVLHAVTRDINRGNILKVPLTITKELMKLTFNKILAVDKLAKDFIKNPLKAGFNLVKGIIQAPVVLFKNICKLFGEEDDEEERRIQLEMEIRRQQLEEQRKIGIAVSACYSVSESQWLRRPDESIDSYFGKLIDDWKEGVKQRRVQVGFLIFANQIKAHLEAGNLREAYHLSPQTHVRDLIPPVVIVHTFRELALSSVKLQTGLISFETAIKIYDESQNEIIIAANEMFAASETLNTVSSHVIKEYDNLKSANESFNNTLNALKTENNKLAGADQKLNALINNPGALQALRNRIQTTARANATAR